MEYLQELEDQSWLWVELCGISMSDTARCVVCHDLFAQRICQMISSDDPTSGERFIPSSVTLLALSTSPSRLSLRQQRIRRSLLLQRRFRPCLSHRSKRRRQPNVFAQKRAVEGQDSASRLSSCCGKRGFMTSWMQGRCVPRVYGFLASGILRC